MSTRSRAATPSVTCYFVEGKRKGRKFCEAFAEGAGGAFTCGLRELAPGPAAFYGVHPGTRHLFRQAKARQGQGGANWYYIDNGYFGRGEYYRVTRNALQHVPRPGDRGDAHRLAKLRVAVAAWRRPGRHILLCPPGCEFMEGHDRNARRWFDETMRALRQATSRKIRVRHKPAPGTPPAVPLADDLEDCFAVVTCLSNVAVEALVAGVPVVVDPASAAAPMGLTDTSAVENAVRPDGRERWAAVLAAQQWTRSEMRRGICWRDLQRG